jgi:hypothetical protein
MQKYIKDDGAVGVQNLDRWPSDSNAVGFLSMTTSTTSVNGLMKVRLTSRSLSVDQLTFPAPAIRVSLAEGRAEVDGGFGWGMRI